MTMARIVVIGGGMCGLSTGMLLANDGHAVTVLERDPAPPPPDPDVAFQDWDRRGVNQFRMLHFVQPGFRKLADRELPEVIAAAGELGALRYNTVSSFGVPARDGDDEFDAVTGRRPVMEAAIARAASACSGLEVRRGVAVKALQVETNGVVPCVTGVVTDDGASFPADLVVDAGGRRSALPRLLQEAGVRPPVEEVDDCGFIYYCRHFRSADGSLPRPTGPLKQDYASVSVLTLPCDRGTWGVGFITSARDGELRAFRDPATWDRVLPLFPMVQPWLDGEPIDAIATIAKIEDRHRDYAPGGTPVALGLAVVGDAWACTNPSIGRGITIAFMHAVALRDTLRTTGLGDLRQFAAAWQHATASTVEPWFQATLQYDRHRLAEVDADIAGENYEPGDPAWEIQHVLAAAAGREPEVLRALQRVTGLLATPDETLSADPSVLEKALAAGSDWRDRPTGGPDRAALLAAIAG